MSWLCVFCDEVATTEKYGLLLCDECQKQMVNNLNEAYRLSKRVLPYFKKKLGVSFNNPIRIEFMEDDDRGRLGYVYYSRCGDDAARNAVIHMRKGMPPHAFEATFAHEVVHAIVAEHKGKRIEPREIEEGLAEYISFCYLRHTAKSHQSKRIQYARRLAKRTDAIYGKGIKLLNKLVSEYGTKRVFHSIIGRDYLLVTNRPKSR